MEPTPGQTAAAPSAPQTAEQAETARLREEVRQLSERVTELEKLKIGSRLADAEHLIGQVYKSFR